MSNPSSISLTLVYLGTRESQLILRLKIRAGDTHIGVLSECFSGLAQIDRIDTVYRSV